ncbi:hypothetical protein ACS0TY_012318 [Phlomoides rotata]
MPSKFTETPCTLEDGFGLVGGVLKRDRNHVRDDTESVSSNDEICFKKHKTKMSRDKVVWNRDLESHFIILCNQGCINGQLLTSSFSPSVFQEMALNLNAIAQKPPNYFTESNLRTKWKNLKAAWKVLNAYKQNLGSGLAWDNDLGTITGDDTVLKGIYAAQSPSNKQVLKHGLPNFEMCTELFKNSVATGAYTRSSQSQVPINATPDEDSIPNEDTIPNEDSIPNENTPYDTPSPMSHSVHETAGGSGSSSRKRRSSSANEDRESLKRGFKSFQCYLDRKMSSADICLDVVQKIEGIPTSLVLKVARHFENVEARNVFLGLNDANRVAWVWDLANE